MYKYFGKLKKFCLEAGLAGNSWNTASQYRSTNRVVTEQRMFLLYHITSWNSAFVIHYLTKANNLSEREGSLKYNIIKIWGIDSKQREKQYKTGQAFSPKQARSFD